MPANTLIRCVTQKQGKQPRTDWFTFASLTGEFVNRLFKVHHKLEAEEICINRQGQQSTVYEVLSPDELSLLIDHWPQLRLPENMPPEPQPLKSKEKIKALSLVGNDEKLAADKRSYNFVRVGSDYPSWEISELKELLDNNGVKYDRRIKKKEKLIELIKTNNL